MLWAKRYSLREETEAERRRQSVLERLRELLQSETAIRSAILTLSLVHPNLYFYKLSCVLIVRLLYDQVMECYSIHLTQTALQRLRERERDSVASEVLSEEYQDVQQQQDSNSCDLLMVQAVYRDRTQKLVQRGGLSVPRLSEMEEEVQRRRLALWLYLLRTPVFDRATLPVLRVVANWMRHIPLISFLPSSVLEIVQYMNRVHFYHSNS